MTMPESPAISPFDIQALLSSGAEDPVLYVKCDEDTGMPTGVDVWAGALVDLDAVIMTRSALLDGLNGRTDPDAVWAFGPTLQACVDEAWERMWGSTDEEDEGIEVEA